MKKLLKKILPFSILYFLMYIRSYVKRYVMKAKIKSGRPLKNKRSKIKISVHLAEHCNLNCASCDHFSPLAEAEFIDPGELERDLKRIGEIFSYDCESITLLGGEPLLHPEIITIMKIARKHFSECTIYVFTNGVILSKKEDAFWQACHDNNISIIISAYPIKIGIEKIKMLAEKFKVSVNWAWEQETNSRNIFYVQRVNLKGDSDIKLNFAMCTRGNSCITLSHGRIFTCTFAPYVHHFNKYFHQNVKITEADYVNIYDDVTADEILTKLAEPIPACRYCDTVSPGRAIKWGISKREISEWT